MKHIGIWNILTARWNITVNLFNVIILAAQWLDGSQKLALAMYLETKRASQLLVRVKLCYNTVHCKKTDNLLLSLAELFT